MRRMVVCWDFHGLIVGAKVLGMTKRRLVLERITVKAKE